MIRGMVCPNEAIHEYTADQKGQTITFIGKRSIPEQSRDHEVIKFLPHIPAIAGAPAGAVVLKPGLGDLGKRSVTVLPLLALLAWGLRAWVDPGFDPGVQLQGLLAGIGERRAPCQR